MRPEPAGAVSEVAGMKIALAVSYVTGAEDRNLAWIERAVTRAKAAGARLVLFPEAALTGLVNNDDPAHDLPLGVPVPGAVTARLGRLAAATGVYVALGLLERAGGVLYDTALLIDIRGETVLKYRRITPGWHGPRAQAPVYGHGTELDLAHTPVGACAFLVCGDIFDDGLVTRVRRLRPDFVLCPLARNFEDGSYDQRRWEEEEEPAYAARAALAGATTLVTNYLGERSWDPDGTFGGALVISARGEVLARMPLGRAGLLLVAAGVPGVALRPPACSWVLDV
jgi:N-carbamoylputrescine amidase